MDDDSTDFGCIGGRDPEPDRSSTGTSAFEVLIEAIAVMTDWRRRSPYRCTVVRGTGREVETYRLQVWPGDGSYHCVDDRTGTVDSYDAAANRYVSVDESTALAPNRLRTDPLAARLAFPLTLPIWGRPSDGYRMVGAFREGEEIIVRPQHRNDHHLFGSVTVNTRKRLVTRLDTLTELCRYERVEPGWSPPVQVDESEARPSE